jgi:hypothetical protein
VRISTGLVVALLALAGVLVLYGLSLRGVL